MNQPLKNQALILASSSKYRRKLLQRLRIDFTCQSPEIDETQLSDELPHDMVKRLSISKAKVIAEKQPDAWVIGSDQIAMFNNEILGKPGSVQSAVEQLTRFSGSSVKFITGVCLYQTQSNAIYYAVNETEVYFKNLTLQTIQQYVKLDNPLDCAGSFKVESLGVCLFEKVVSDDPTALEGLPLIGLCQLMSKAGIDILQN